MTISPVQSESVTLVTEIAILGNGTGIPVGIIEEILPGGTVTVDVTAAQVRSCTFQCLDPTGLLMPAEDGSGELQPTGVEVAISLGFMVNGSTALFPVGVFEVEEADVETDASSAAGAVGGPGPVLTVTGYDRSRKISANAFTDVFTIAQGTTATSAIFQILAAQAPWITATNIAPTDFQVAQQVTQPGDDPWALIVSIAAAAGMVAYFDPAGVLVVRPNPSQAGSPLAIVIQDGPQNLAASVASATSNNPGYNGVIVVGSSLTGTAPVVGTAFDMDPQSPIYALGSYGKRPAPPIQVSTVIDAAQANAMAATLLPQVLGLTRTVTADIIPCPFLDAYDLVYVDNGQTKVDGTFIVQQATLPLDYSQLEALTLVPVGAPITQLAALQGPSVAQFTSTSPIYAGATAFTWSPTTGYSFGGFGVGGVGIGGGGFGFNPPGNWVGNGGILWGGASIWRRRQWNNSDQPGTVDSNGYVWKSDAQYYGSGG